MYFDDNWRLELLMYQKSIDMLSIHHVLYIKSQQYSFNGCER